MRQSTTRTSCLHLPGRPEPPERRPELFPEFRTKTEISDLQGCKLAQIDAFCRPFGALAYGIVIA